MYMTIFRIKTKSVQNVAYLIKFGYRLFP